VKDAEKYIVLKPWDIAGRYLSGGMFHATSKTTLNEKIELYFNDFEFSSLMIQENYLRPTPDIARNAGTLKDQKFKALELAEKASESISNADLVDAMIHGSQQQWSLMPTHAVFSCVTPAYYMHGASSGQYAFTTWLGNNSKQGKLLRLLREIQGHMRLRISGDRNEVRQAYMQTLFDRLVRRFAVDGAGAVDEIIGLMDEYYLTKEDFDSIVELALGGVGEGLMKEVSSNAKAAFTRKYRPTATILLFGG
jgi:replication factor C subunit 1